MKAEDMPPYRPTPERLAELEARWQKQAEQNGAFAALHIQQSQDRFALEQEVARLTARVVELEQLALEQRAGIQRYSSKAFKARAQQHQALADQAEGNTEQEADEEV